MINKSIILLNLFLFLLVGCSLDYKNTGVINPDNVWKDKAMINSFLTDIYGSMLPGWPINANGTDEGMNGPTSMSEYTRGQITVDNCGQGLGYANIDKINFFLERLDQATVLSDKEKQEMSAQALFWRAWDYFGKVTAVGGVPLILSFQDVTNLPSLFVSRNSTSECMNQIIKDLDEAIVALPDKWDNKEYGRIDKGCAMAFKGRVLLWYASPLFNPSNALSRWEAAYAANKAAIEFLTDNGKGLYTGKFEDIWYEERNREVVMVNQYYYPDHALDQKNIRPEPLTKDMADQNQAIMSLLMAYPKRDGSLLKLDKNRLEIDEAYNEQFMTDFYIGRDPRFYATVFCPGTAYPAKDMLDADKKYWNVWKKVTDEESESGYKYITLIFDELQRGIGGGSSGYFQFKGLDQHLTVTTVYQAEVDWIEIRFAEVLMNYGECANELNKSDEALQVLYDIRKRAGIDASSGRYGITATGQGEIRQAYVDERFIEFAYEGKRFGDLRRWKRFDILNSIKYRSGLNAVIKDEKNIATFDWTKDMYDPEIRKMFRFEYVECLDGDKQYMFNLDLNHWFYPIKKEDLDRNPELKQNNEWGGSFDPLK